MTERHTAAVIKALQARFTAPRVWLVGLAFRDLDGFVLELATPSDEVGRSAVPFDVRIVKRLQRLEPVRYVKVCGVWLLCTVTLLDAIKRIGGGFCPTCNAPTTVEALGPDEEPADLGPPGILSIEGVVAAVVKASSTAPGVPMAPAPISTTPVTAPPPPDELRGSCGCGYPLCPHGHCSDSCDGFTCGFCAPRGADE